MNTQISAPSALELERLKASLSIDLEREKSRLQTELEQEKHRLSAQREEEARRAKRSEVVYLELGQHMRSLNTFLWQVPGLVIAITGGLWFGAASIENLQSKRIALGFTAAVDLLMIPIVWRMRMLFQRNLAYQMKYESNTLDGPAAASSWKYVVIGIWTLLLGAGGVISVCGAISPELVRRSEPSGLVAAHKESNSRPAAAPEQGQPALPASTGNAQERTGAKGQARASDGRSAANPAPTADGAVSGNVK
ncbi:hypothetical protein [Ramlibacter rhizophilus]|uniref:Uncharacterized protein n=1 Tax=Ramlibacter rhizophilus TaxID=1781167 RepID=A0A4Z0BYJ3_9BURK|nr:hypothetical protein [Ramlibacter rhizophilus]TFZ03368.1 hypothetical protein EZ242_05655 [Ramlibacter rhizophilus]